MSDIEYDTFERAVVPGHSEADRLRAELTRLADLAVDVLHGRRHSGELLLAIKPYRSPASLGASSEPSEGPA